MATRYWVGGTGTWSTTNTTSWSTTSGGPGGASVPTASDDVIFDTGSSTGSYSVNFSSSVCLSFTAGPSTGNFNIASGTVTVYGDFSITGSTGTFATGNGYIIYGNFNYTGSQGLRGSINMSSTTTGKTFNNTTANSTAFATFVGIGGGWTMSGIWAGNVTLSAGTLDLGSTVITFPGTAVTASFVVSNNTNTKVLNLNAASVSARSFTFYNNSSSTTVIAGTSTLSMYSSTTTLSEGTFFNSGNFTFNNFVVSPTVLARPNIFFVGNSTFNNFTINAPTSDYVFNCNVLDPITINGTFTVTGGTYTRRVAFMVYLAYSPNPTSTNITAANKSLSYVDFYGINASGAAAPFSGTNIGDAGGNTGISGTTPKTVYWNLLAGGNYTSNAYATSSGGAVSVANFPLPQDTLIIDDAGLNSGATIVFSTGSFMVANLISIRTITWGFNFSSARFFGNITVPAPFSISTTFGVLFQGFNKTITLNVLGATTVATAGTVTLNVPTISTLSITAGTCVLGNNISANSATATNLTQGTLDLNNFTFTVLAFNSNNSNIRSIAFGSSGVIRINSSVTNGSFFSMSSSTGFSYTGTSNIQLNGTNPSAILLSVTTSSATTESQALNFTVLSGGTYSFIAPSVLKDLTIDNGFAGNINNSSGVARTVYGNLLLGTSVTVPSTVLFAFAGGSGTKTITTAGKQFSSSFDGSCTWEFQDALTASSSTMTLAAGTVKLKSGTTNTIGTFATSGATLKYLASTTSGTQATISQAAGTVAATFLSIQDSNATGGATFDANFANGNVDAGNNNGWDFGIIPINVLISESISLQDASIPTQIFFKAISEVLGLADPSTVTAAFTSAASEAITSADSVAGGTAFASSILESLVVDDSSTVFKTFNVSIDEPQTIQDAANVIASFISAVSENSHLSDTPTVSANFLLNATENFEVLGGETASKTQYVTATEAQTLQEAQSTSASFLSDALENTGLDDSLNGAATFVGNVSEPTTIQESIIGVAAKIIADVTEALTVSNAQTAVLSFVANISENINVADGETAVKTQYAILVEPLTLGEEQNVFAWVRVENDAPTSWSLIDNRQ